MQEYKEVVKAIVIMNIVCFVVGLLMGSAICWNP